MKFIVKLFAEITIKSDSVRRKMVRQLYHNLHTVLTEDALGQSAVNYGAAVLAVSAVFDRTTKKYGRRGIQYVHLDAGHAAQNICLQATALGLGTVPIGAFHDDRVAKTLRLPADEVPLYLLPVGTP